MSNELTHKLRQTLKAVRLAYLSIGSSKACPICSWTGHSFVKRTFPHKPAASYLCPRCDCAERHRLSYYALKDKIPKFAEKTLHFAPENSIEPWLRKVSKDYLSVDLYSPHVMQKMDITDLQLEDNSFSLLWCSHVLEHIDDDKKAMQELFRVLRPSALAVIMVPIYGETTYEDPTITSPEKRLIHFKQEDHVRLYGLDIRQRLEQVGFEVEVLSASDLPQEDVAKYSLSYPSTKEIFLCVKPAVTA